MTAIADLTTYLTSLDNPVYRYNGQKTNVGTKRKMRSTWLIAQNAGSAPTTAVVPSKTTPGVIGAENGQLGEAASLELYVSKMLFDIQGLDDGFMSTRGGYHWSLMLYDRLSHQGGLDASVTSAQTTNLPTAALTRYTTGDGVMACLECYTAASGGGTGATDITVSYTNQAGTSGRTSPATTMRGTASSSIDNNMALIQGTLTPLSLQQGDTGVRAVASLTCSATMTTPGSFGITLIKPLAIIPLGHARSTFWMALHQCCNFIKLQSGYALGATLMQTYTPYVSGTDNNGSQSNTVTHLGMAMEVAEI